MKFVIFYFTLFVASCFSSPAVKNLDAVNRISDFDMHPHKQKTENFFKPLNEQEESKDYWINEAKAFVEKQVKQQPNTNTARNVIMFLGDGMSHYSIAGARLLMGGEEKKLYFENFPYTASSKTYCVDLQVSESACTAVAYLSGVKTNDGVIGINAKSSSANCADSIDESNYVDSIATWFQDKNRSTGVVTTTRITHASPAGLYAHVTNRDWEDNSYVVEDGCDDTIVDDIAEQLIHGKTGSKFKVILGGGSRHFVNNDSTTDHGTSGRRFDGKNLIDEWKNLNPTGRYVKNRQELLDTPNDVDKLFGLFNSDHIQYYIDILRDNLEAEKPSLADMTKKAIEILDTDEKGYFLFVEGGRIDHGHHGNQGKHALSEAVEFSKAIEEATKMVNLNETLIIVTADHGHVMTLSGYADRGHDIFGVAGTGDDNLPYLTLSYANGEGNYETYKNGERVDPTKVESYSNDFNNHKFPATVPLESETHGGEDVGIWAIGPWAHLFQGTLEQNVIAHIMAYASCVGNGLKACDN
ncbi:hypothetical protein PVAND_012961 [Polypedilum vanderplanki]|uniref:alkaline phosphatase n=1 Tax=Polypedilum vanderplanki TaxID=319348 RepID=A0A9J6CPA4_POLVA|nr:hypothetical protein PVAND_012961 [Polypedilum vanderplanki]